MPLLILPIVWVAAAAGRRLNSLVLRGSPTGILPIERSLFGLATGLGVLAYGILALGLVRLLSQAPAIVWLLVLAVIGWREHVALANEVVAGLRGLRFSLVGIVVGLAFAGCAFVALVGCFAPPTGLEWDSLSYHLADPKIYLQNHRIFYLPWESHSNFAFTMEMLYTIGLMAHSIQLAKLFHFTLAVAGTLATYLIGARLVSRAAGVIAALIFASIPLVLWEAGTAYVDLGATAFGALGLLALVNWADMALTPAPSPTEFKAPPKEALSSASGRGVKEVAAVSTPPPRPTPSRGLGGSIGGRVAEGREGGHDKAGSQAWLWLSAIMMGWMVSVKATSLIPVFLFALFILIRQWRAGVPAAFKQAVLYGVVAVVVGGVWYIKSWLYTGNPFYPFAYSVFGGRYWDAYNATQYALSQAQFGVGHRPLDLLTLPWNFTMYLMPGHSLPPGKDKGFNDYQSYSTALNPIFLAALFAPAFIRMKAKPLIGVLGVYSLVSVVIWFLLTQQVRYMLPLFPALCVLAAYVLVELWSMRAIAGYALAALFAVSVAASLAIAIWIDPAGVSAEAPIAFGSEQQSAYLSHFFPPYAAMQYLNTQTPPDAKVVLYGEPRGFYLDRQYIWGDPGHSLLIPYGHLQTPQALAAYFKRRGYNYILINYSGAPVTPGRDWAGMVYALTAGSGVPPVYQDHGISIYRL